MFDFVSDGLLKALVYIGTAAAFLVAIGGIAGIILAIRSDNAVEKISKELVATRFAVSGRTISSAQVEELRPALEECWKGVNVQVYDMHDSEAASFASSLEHAFKDAGFNVIIGDLPTLDVGTGFDLTLFMPRATGADAMRIILSSKLHSILTSFGFSVGGISEATTRPKDQYLNITDVNKYVQTPEYCIIYIQRRPPARFVGPPYLGRP